MTNALPAPQTIGSPWRFFLFVFVLSIPFYVLGATGARLTSLPQLPASALMAFVPMVGASILVFCQRGTSGTVAWYRDMRNSHWHGHAVWYLTALLIMPAVCIAEFTILRLTGSTVPIPQFAFGEAMFMFAAFFIAAIGEEVGWQGYAYPALRKRMGILVSAIVLGLPSGAALRLETKRTISHLARPTTIIAFYADDAILEIVDGLTNVAGVVAVEDLKGSADQWVARWSPIVPGQAAKPPVQLIKDPVVLKALESLSGLVNKSHALLTSSYEDWAKDVLRILRARGHSADPKDIKSWAIKDGWKPGAANDLAKLAKKIFELKTKPSLAGIANANDRYDRWRKMPK